MTQQNSIGVLLKKATIVDPQSPFHNQQKDILIASGRIKAIAGNIDKEEGVKCIEYDNLHVSQGWFDPSVSFGEPGFEERETLANGLETAAKSGFTDIILNPNTDPLTGSHSEVSHILKSGQGHTTKLHTAGVLTENANGKHMASLYDMHLAGAIAFGDYKKHIENPSVLKVALEYVQSFEGLICVYPCDTLLSQNGLMHEGVASIQLGMKGIPPIAETTAIARDLEILKHTEGRLHFAFVSTAAGVALIRKAKKEGLAVSCSVSLPHLYFTDNDLKTFDANLKVFPPLRDKSDREALRKGLLDGTIDMISCMHEPVNVELKELEFAYALDGSIGLEAAFGILSGIFTLEKVINFLTRGRKHFGIATPEIAVDAPVNMTLFDPDAQSVLSQDMLYSSSKNCAFLGTSLTGKVYSTLREQLWTLTDA